MSNIETLEPIMTNSTLLNFLLSQLLDDIIIGNANCKAITNYNYTVLPLNTLQHLVVEEIFDHVIQNKDKLCITRKDQLLLYVKGEGRVRKNCEI